MPEGDSAWQTAKRLRDVLEGQALRHTDFRVPSYATVDLSGRVVDEVLSRGKHLLIRVGDRTIHSHLKMEGRWDVHPVGTRWRRPAHAARIVLRTDSDEAVGFWLGIAEVIERDRESDAVGHLGPDLLGPDWDADEAVRRLQQQSDRPVFLALLDQRNLAGLGNEYVNELLFIAGLAPTRPVTEVPDLKRLVTRAHQVINANRDRARRTFTGVSRRGQERWVYGRDRDTCRRCGGPIRRGSLGDSPAAQRDTFWCPACQPDQSGD